MKLFLPSVFFVLSSFFAQTIFAAETKEFAAKDLTEVTIANPSGNVKISATTGDKAIVTADKKKFSDKCEMTIETKGHALTVKVEKKSTFSTADCDVNFELKTPKLVKISAKLGSGNLQVSDTNGELDFKLGSGNLTAKGLFAKVDGHAGNGNVEINGMGENGEIKSGNGNIELTYARAPTKGSLDVKIGSGDVTISLPKNTKLKTHVFAGAGNVSNEFGNVANATFSVDVKAGAGNVKVKSY